jgi:Uma2 family endonuclease
MTSFLVRVIGEFVESRDLGQVFLIESEVRLATQKTRRLPDIFFVAQDRLHIVKKTHTEGAPDLIIEIVSPDSSARDWRQKYLEYEAAGVREYWVIDPMAERLEAYALAGNDRYERLPEANGRVNSTVLAGLYIKPAWLWQDRLPKVRQITRELGLE